LARRYPDFYHESPHNMFLDALTTRGIPGLLLLLAFCGLGLIVSRDRQGAVRSLILSRDRKGAVGSELTAALVASLVVHQFVVFVVPTALYFYLLVALLVTQPTWPVPERRSAPWLFPIGIAASLLFAGFALRLIVADYALAVANQRIASGDASGAAQEYLTVLRWKPSGSGDDLNYSRAMAQLAARAPSLAPRVQASEQAMEAAIRATRTAEERQNAWYNLATLLALQNDAAGVERSLRNAIAWSPTWFKPHWALAQLLEATHHRDAALREARFALDLDGGRDPEVSETWQKLQQPSNPEP